MASFLDSEAVVVAETLDRAAWLDARQGGLGGSDASVVCGVSRWRGPVELWEEKTAATIIDGAAGESARWGTLLEPVVRDEVARIEALEIVDAPALLAHGERPWQQASLDGVIHGVDGPAIYEGKTVGPKGMRFWDDAGVPDAYVLQVQHYLAVTGWSEALIACLMSGQRLELRHIVRDDVLIGLLTEAEASFWDCVTRRVPPAERPSVTREVRVVLGRRSWSGDVARFS